MRKFAKIKREKFHDAVAMELTSIKKFAAKIGVNSDYLSRLSSTTPSSCRCTPEFASVILNGFDGKYRFDDLFFWAK